MLVGYHFGKNYEFIETALAPYSRIFLLLTIVIILGWLIKRQVANHKKGDRLS